MVACALLVLFQACAIADNASAQPQTETVAAESRTDPGPPPEVSLLTIGPGEIFFERFGHNAIVVRDPASGRAVAYNYGIFDFDQQDFLLNFARGRMRYRMAVDELDDDLEMYREERREIVEQRLALTPPQARDLVAFLEWNARPENAQYRYDYFEANCSTRVRDALDRALGGALHAQSEGRSRGYTWRLDALRLMAPEPVLMLLIDLGLGPYADQRIDYWQESFVPATLADVVTGVNNGSGALAAPAATLARGDVEPAPVLPPDLRWPFLGLGIVLGAIVYTLGGSASAARRVPLATFALLFELFCGVGGLLLLFLWFGTEHRAAWRNENLLLLNPLCLALLPAWFGIARGRLRDRPRARAIAWIVAVIAAIALFSKILPTFAQANLHWIVLLLPIHLALALRLRRPA
ncbi:MAG: lipoprotein N-acyltransferase Lnb domain-containing protein [Dokdonella sp.]|uniref:lipoprotein N-acyltransferase Lnb domain-containing protein n=1 Tax=Dokdonella sp. TaxID=2291710 RepID=UPI003F7D6395